MRIVGIDLDGTLLGADLIISESDKRILTKLYCDGIHIVLISGRHKFEVDSILTKNGLTLPFWIIVNDGQYIFDNQGRLIKSFPLLGTTDLRHICMRIKKRPIMIYTNKHDYRLCDFSLPLFSKKLFFREYRNIIFFPLLLRDIIIEKIALSDTIQDNDLVLLKKYFTVHRLSNGRIEILHHEVNKYNAVMYVLRQLNISPSEMVYFGDDGNDIECFQNLPNCVAMGNASDEIKTIARFLTDSNVNSGVSSAIIKLVYNGIL